MSPKRVRKTSITPRKSKRTSDSQVIQVLPVPENFILVFLPEDLIYEIVTFFVHPNGILINDFLNIQVVSRKFHQIINSIYLWRSIPLNLCSNHAFNINKFKFIENKSTGTEGACYHSVDRSTNQHIAIKRARVYPEVNINFKIG